MELIVRGYLAYSLWPRGRLAAERAAASLPGPRRWFPLAVLGVAPGWVGLQVLLAVLAFATSIAALDVTARLIRSPGVAIGLLLALVIARFALSWAAALVDAAVTRAVHRAALAAVLQRRARAPIERLQRVLLRDLDLVLEGALGVHKLAALPLGLAGALAFVFATYGPSALLGFGGVAVFVPVSLGLGVASARALRAVMAASERRIEHCTRWIAWAAYALDWGMRAPLAAIGALLSTEARLRNKDSAIRSSEGYLVAFGRIVPVVLALAAGWLLGGATGAPLAALWIAGPVIGALLELGRSAAELGQADAAWRELAAAPSAPPREGDGDLVLGLDWDLWTGTVADNLLAPVYVAAPLLVALGLVPELGESVDAVLSRPITAGGKTVSAGQRLRLLVARGIVLAGATRRRLVLDVPLTSLDAANRARVCELVSAAPLACAVSAIEPRAPEVPPETSTPAGQGSAPGDNAWRRGAGGAVARRFGPIAAVFLAPAIGLALVGAIAADTVDAAASVRLVVITAGSVAIAIAAGFVFEARIRAWTGRRVVQLLAVPYAWSAADLVQRASRDATTVMERVAWYAHDATWIAALLAVAALALLAALHAVGAVVVGATAAAIAALWRLLLGSVVRARLRSIAAASAIPVIAEDLIASEHLRAALAAAAEIRAGLVQARFDELLAARLETALSKLALGRWVELTAGAAVVATVALLRASDLPIEAAAFVLTSALAVVHHLLQLFLAVTGFVAQRASIARLAPPPSEATLAAAPSFTETEHAIEFAPVRSEHSGASYRGFRLPVVGLASLCGSSGEGKTQLLRALARFATPDAERDGVYYLDHHWRAIAEWASGHPVAGVTELLAALAPPRVVLLDEVLAHDDLDAAHAELQRLAAWCARCGVLAVVVDHRVELPVRICVADLLDRTMPALRQPVSVTTGAAGQRRRMRSRRSTWAVRFDSRTMRSSARR